jgi:hypothetical protein
MIARKHPRAEAAAAEELAALERQRAEAAERLAAIQVRRASRTP